MDVEQEFSNAEQKVEHVLKNYERARNSDDFLIWVVKHHIEEANLNNFEEYKNTTKSKSIARARRLIQNTQGRLLPTDPEILKKRMEKEEEVRSYFADKGRLDIYRKYKKLKDEDEEDEDN